MRPLEHIIVEARGKVGVITLNRPKMLNALSFGVFREIATAVDDLEADAGIGCIVLTGNEKAFAAVKSAFLEFIRAMAEFASGNGIETGFGGAVRQALAWGKRLSNLEKRAEQFVNGEVPFQPGLVTESYSFEYRRRRSGPPRAKN